MHGNIDTILALAKRNIQTNPTIAKKSVESVVTRYIEEIAKEAAEVLPEVKEQNAIHLTDELGDVFWDFINLVSLCADRGLIDSVDDVFIAAVDKYTERSKAFSESNDEKWNEIKGVQKARLAKKHTYRYG
ncbi:MAG: MazG nucleotide pyrophosphohydrolase domain-containing protein [Candidatus Paceibacterota bacterium]